MLDRQQTEIREGKGDEMDLNLDIAIGFNYVNLQNTQQFAIKSKLINILILLSQRINLLHKPTENFCPSPSALQSILASFSSLFCFLRFATLPTWSTLHALRQEIMYSLRECVCSRISVRLSVHG